MKAALVLAFLAVANSAFIDNTIFGDALWHKNFDAFYRQHMLTDHTGIRPNYMFDTEGIEGVVNPSLNDKYFQPSLIFFKGPDGKIISYYAHQGIDKINSIPEVKNAFDGLYGAADKVAVHFSPEEVLGGYKTVVPGHFFQPEHNFALGRFMQDMPITHNFVPMKFAKQGVFSNTFNIDALPNFYKYPVALDMTRTLFDSSVVPTGHALTGLPVAAAAPAPIVSAIPVANSAIMGSGVNSFFRSGLTPAYHLVKADYPYFTAAPATGLVDSALIKNSNILGSNIVPASAGGITLEKAPCMGVGCMGSEYVPTFRSHHLVNPVVPLAYTDPMASYIPLTI